MASGKDLKMRVGEAAFMTMTMLVATKFVVYAIAGVAGIAVVVHAFLNA